MRVSVVICTFNRAAGLRDTLASLRRQNYPEFEVVVVNGPSTDGTDLVIAEHEHLIRAASCPLPNLSMSRNIGIRASAGDVVAFIDDDALPEFDWLTQAVAAFDDPEVAGCGGIVFDHTGMDLQYRYSAANRFGEPTWSVAQPYDDLCAPGAFMFPYLQGTNALFRRDVLERIGGFDETFEYYLDETDVCCRIVDAGYVLRQLSTAPVHHKFLPSNIRDHQRVVTNWFPLVKNHTYFGYRHAARDVGEDEVLEHAEQFLARRVADAKWHEDAGRLPAGSAQRARTIGEDAMRLGAELGRSRADLQLGPVSWPRPEFKPYDAPYDPGRKRYVLVSSGYGENMTGGVARYTTDLAEGLAASGAEVRVITSSASHSTVDLEQGIWVHRLRPPTAGESGVEPGVSEPINDFTTAVAGELQRIEEWAPVDVAYGALWDVELLGVLRRTAVPTMVHLVTPAAIAASQAGFMEDPHSRAFIERLMDLEREVLATTDLLHANGNPVVETIEYYYGPLRDPERCQVVALGLRDQTPTVPVIRRDQRTTVLFVGRLEARKGIDLFLASVERLAPTMPDVVWRVVGADLPLRPGEDPVGDAFLAAHADDHWIERVELVGPVSDDQLHAEYAASDLVVLPSRYESFGLVMLEAMMHGKALVSSNVGGIVEVVRAGVDGILITPDDAAALTDAVAALLDDAGRRRQLGTTARARYLEHFAMEPATARFVAAADRLRFHAAGSAAVPIPPTAALHDTAPRRPTARFGRGQSLELDLTPSSRWRLVLSSDDAATIALTHDGVERAELLAGGLHRIEVAPGTSAVRVVTGGVRVHGVIELAGRSA
jgi:glycogen(starch) synthase